MMEVLLNTLERGAMSFLKCPSLKKLSSTFSVPSSKFSSRFVITIGQMQTLHNSSELVPLTIFCIPCSIETFHPLGTIAPFKFMPLRLSGVRFSLE